MKTKFHLWSLVAFTLMSVTPVGATVIIADSFDGSGAASLHGTSPNIFSSAITAAGGSAVWNAGAAFRADGSVVNGSFVSAGLPVGSYINDTKGNGDGLFTLTATIAGITGGTTADVNRWVSVNFLSPPGGAGAFNPNNAIYNSPNRGVGIALRRQATGTTYFNITPGGTGAVTTNWPAVADDVTFSVELDLRSWNGTTDFGSLRFFRDGSGSPEHTVALTADYDFTHVGFGANMGASSTISDFSLTQVPEPSSSLLLLLAGSVAVLRRRR